jgi:sulfur relay (sulfurtransferase) DsrF/TusC family protein
LHFFFSIESAVVLLITNFPVFQVTALEALETIFATEAAAKQVALAIVLETGFVSLVCKNSSASILPCFVFWSHMVLIIYVCPFYS